MTTCKASYRLEQRVHVKSSSAAVRAGVGDDGSAGGARGSKRAAKGPRGS